MTFFNFPKRSSSDDDALDQALDAWAGGEQLRHSEVVEESPREAQLKPNDLANDALEFHRWADETRRTDPAATGPAASTWNRVLRSTAQAESRGGDMNSAALSNESQSAIVYDSRPYQPKNISRYLNLAATIAIVFAVTIGGWFAMSQLPPGGDGRFAAIQGTPEGAESATCDVEPLTVDEVVAIVENPYSTVEPSWFGTPEPDSDTPSELLAHDLEYVDLTDAQRMLLPSPYQAAYSVPEEGSYAEASEAAENIMNCLIHGTYGQVWAVMEPTMIQNYILFPYPVYREEAMIREHIQERIDQPYDSGQSYFSLNTELDFAINPRRGDARIWLTDSPEILDYDKIVLIGMQAVDDDGNIVFTNDWNASTVEGDESRSNGTSLILVHSESTDTWYFFNWHAPRG